MAGNEIGSTWNDRSEDSLVSISYPEIPTLLDVVGKALVFYEGKIYTTWNGSGIKSQSQP